MAANQARRRTDIDFAPNIGSGSQPPKTFVYQKLDPDPNEDSIRLVLIESSTNIDDPLLCSLIHVKFAEKRRYKALSYMWGTEAVKQKIFLDGAEFYIGQNLWDALHYLRGLGNQMPFWIDAICINQLDVPERNKQLAMMKWIYFRADTVVIWLGRKYSKYQTRIKSTARDIDLQGTNHDEPQKWRIAGDATVEPGETSEAVSVGLNKEGGVSASDEEREMVMKLCTDGYWDRLWIIQEIGRAHQKEVCFGNLAMGWNAFIELATLHNSSCEGPLRLNRLLQEKYSGSHTLRKLLEDHRKALCKEPRDKIYGLVGLAADAIGFPMDYEKSLIDIWKDAMEFMNRRGLLPMSDVIPFGRLVKSLLIGDHLGPIEQALQPYEPRPDSALTLEDPDGPRVFQHKDYIIGCIMAIGPSTQEIISSLNKADQWAALIQKHFSKELGEAHRENDTLMHTIQDSDQTLLASVCYSHVGNVRWKKDLNDWSTDALPSHMQNVRAAKSQYSVSSISKSQTSPNDTQIGGGNSHLFLIENGYRGETPWKTGIVSGLAQPGDLVCWVDGVEKTLVLRVTPQESMLQVFGTALFTDDFRIHDKAFHANRLS
jgi:hypothetical protein